MKMPPSSTLTGFIDEWRRSPSECIREVKGVWNASSFAAELCVGCLGLATLYDALEEHERGDRDLEIRESSVLLFVAATGWMVHNVNPQRINRSVSKIWTILCALRTSNAGSAVKRGHAEDTMHARSCHATVIFAVTSQSLVDVICRGVLECQASATRTRLLQHLALPVLRPHRSNAE